MMTLFRSLVAFLLLPTSLCAQLPYTQSNALPGHLRRTYEVRLNTELNGSMVNVITSGTNVTWDLSAHPLETPFPYEVYYEPAAQTPYHSQFPSANQVVREGDISDEAYYSYVNNSALDMRLLGAVRLLNGEDSVINFCPDPFQIMEYPMNIGSGVQHIYQSPCNGETDHWTIMATGNVLYAGGSINNLVMWRSIFTTNTGFQDTSFFWTQHDNVMFPVVVYNPGVQLRVRKPIWDVVLSIPDAPEAASGFSIAPNPALDELVIKLDEPASSRHHVLVLDAMGRIVKDLEPLFQGMDRSVFNVADLTAGTYFIELRSDDVPARRGPFVKQ